MDELTQLLNRLENALDDTCKVEKEPDGMFTEYQWTVCPEEREELLRLVKKVRSKKDS